jgi:hypothetical protein
MNEAMKTLDERRNSFPGTYRRLPHLMKQLFGTACVFCALVLVSCQFTQTPQRRVTVQSMASHHWKKVSSSPPTFYPSGVAADCHTDHWSGEWVYTGDEKGTRYFIPLRGLGSSRQAWIQEALSARSGRKLAEVAAGDEQIRSRNFKNLVLFGPPTYSALLVAAMAGASPSELDIHRIQKEWDSSKEPHG